MRPLCQQHGSLQCIQAPVGPDVGMVVPFYSAVRPNRSHRLSKLRIIGKKGAPVSIAPQRFCREKRGTSYQGGASARFSVVGRSKDLRAILDHCQMVLGCIPVDLLQDGRLLEKANM